MQLTSILLLEYQDLSPLLTALFWPEEERALQKWKGDKGVRLSTVWEKDQAKYIRDRLVPNQSIVLPHHSLIRQHLPFPNLWHI